MRASIPGAGRGTRDGAKKVLLEVLSILVAVVFIYMFALANIEECCSNQV